MSTEVGATDSEAARTSVLLMVEQLRRTVPGGIGTYTRGLINGLLAIDRKTRPLIALLASKSATQPDPLRSFAVPITTAPFPSKVATQLWERNLLRIRTGQQLVHAVSFGAPSTSVPLVMTVHDLAWQTTPDAFPPRGRRWHEAALQHAAKRVAHFVVPSAAVAHALCNAGHRISSDRVTVIEEGADHLPAPDELGVQQLLRKLDVRGEFLLACGTLEPRKNLARLVEAYGAMRGQLPEPWPLVIVGPQGWGDGAPAAIDGVKFAGHVAPAVLAGLYRAARTVAYVPLIEGFGLPVVEAMSVGTPVVSSDVPSSGGATEIVDPLSVDDIARGLLAVCSNDERRKELIGFGEKRIAPLTWQAVAESHFSLWRDVIARVR